MYFILYLIKLSVDTYHIHFNYNNNHELLNILVTPLSSYILNGYPYKTLQKKHIEFKQFFV